MYLTAIVIQILLNTFQNIFTLKVGLLLVCAFCVYTYYNI